MKKKLNIRRLLIAAPIVVVAIVMLVTVLPAIWKGIVIILKALVPNIWTIFGYAYTAFIAFLVGRKKGKKNVTSEN